MTIKIQPAQTITDGLVMSKEAFLEVSTDVPIAFTKNLNYYVVTGRVKIMTASVEQPETKGCACRWDADDNRVATCARHQGWLDVVQEWADRAKEAESKLAQPKSIGPRPTYGAVGTRDVDVAAAMERWDAQAAALAQPECGYDDTTGNCTRENCCRAEQPEPQGPKGYAMALNEAALNLRKRYETDLLSTPLWSEFERARNKLARSTALAQPEPTAQILADRLVNAVIAFATPEGGDVSDIGLQPEPVPIGEVKSVVFGASGFHVYLYPNQRMPKVGDKLFPSAALAQPEPVEPLSLEKVKEILRESGYDTASAQERADFINGIRHGEMAHGINGAAAKGGAV